MTVTNSTLAANTATCTAEDSASCLAFGGGINNESTGTVTVTNSTFTENIATCTAQDTGTCSAFGGGINNESTGTVTVTNSTFKENIATCIADLGTCSAVGGGINNESTGTVTVTDSTFTDNGETCMATDPGSCEALTLALLPDSDTNPVGTTHTVTATVRDRGIGHGGTVVAFTVSGANPGATGTCFPDECVTLANGEVTFTYTGTNPGLDIISATISNATGLSSTVTATKTWTAVPGGGGGGGGGGDDDDDDDDDDGDGGSRRRGRITIIEDGWHGGRHASRPRAGDVRVPHQEPRADRRSAWPTTPPAAFKDLRAGTYTVAQDKKDGWRLDKIVCQDPTKNTKVVLDTRRAVIKLKAGEHVTCTFTNTKKQTAGPKVAMPIM